MSEADPMTAMLSSATDGQLREACVSIAAERKVLLRRLNAIRKEQQRRIDAEKESKAREKWATR